MTIALKPTVGRIIHCWPERHEKPEGETMTCAAIVCGVTDRLHVHYFLPEGSNGTAEFPLDPVDRPTKGGWWWPPRA